jgi:hypothetical protein
VSAAGGWSLLVDVSPRGLTAREAAKRLLARGLGGRFAASLG